MKLVNEAILTIKAQILQSGSKIKWSILSCSCQCTRFAVLGVRTPITKLVNKAILTIKEEILQPRSEIKRSVLHVPASAQGLLCQECHTVYHYHEAGVNKVFFT